MSFKDDFIEALRSVKRDFFRENEYTDNQREYGQQAGGASESVERIPIEVPPPVEPVPAPEARQPIENPPPASDEDVLEAFRQASAVDEDTYDAEDDYEDELNEPVRDAVPYRSYTPDMNAGASDSVNVYDDHGAGRAYINFGDNGLYDDDKTIISKNTVIRGNMETEDSIRLLGQVLGDIDCKANIVVAGKVRGNTSASNAYIFDAQVDGDVRCEDVITISNDAWVLGNLRAQQAEIDGKVKGNMEIRHMVSIGASSSILGDISTDELEIKRGAFVNGQIMMYSPSRDVLDRFDRFGE